ncbi:MAG TPA: amino acid ABC transporter permease [Microbacteriaceae bacterium]|nr:amino acid ABC transporter permease [Microbacteriaceae bacterium]
MTGLWDGLLLGLGTTLLIWVGAIVVSLVLGVPLSALRRAEHWAPRLIGGAWAALARGIPPIVWIILVFYGLKFGPFQAFPPLAAMVALGVVNSAYVGDAIRAGLDSVPRGQWEAAKATGLGGVVTMGRVILPQAFPIMLATITAYSITLLKNTALASIIGVSEMLYYAYQAVSTGTNPLVAFLAAGVIYLACTVPLGFLARWIETRSVIAVVR